jgi:hypothetical protein
MVLTCSPSSFFDFASSIPLLRPRTDWLAKREWSKIWGWIKNTISSKWWDEKTIDQLLF